MATNLLMWAILISGTYYWFTLVRELFPNPDAEQITITVPYPGATPEDVERAIALRIERELRDVDEVKEVASTAYEGVCVVTVTLEEDADRDRVLNAVRGRIDRVEPDLPADAEEPEILEVRPYIPVIAVVVHGDVSEARLREEALRVRDDLKDLGGVSELALLGVRNREIWATVEPERLEEHGLTFGGVARAVAEANLDVSGGQLEGEHGNVRLRTMGERRRALALEDLVILAGASGEAVRLRDVARVEETFEDRVTQGRLGGERAVTIWVFKTPEQDALEISERVQRYCVEQGERLGGAVRVDTFTDLARFVEGRIDLMVRNARAGIVLVVVTLALFLSLRVAFWVATGLIVSLLGTFTAMALMGISINLLSLFGLIIVLGLIVDDAVVIGESVHGRIQAGEDPLEAAPRGAMAVARPVVAAVLTTIIAFMPLHFMSGSLGYFLAELPLVVIAALSVSLIEAFVILPGHLGHVRRPRPRAPHLAGASAGPEHRASPFRRLGAWRDEWLERRVFRGFERLLRFVLRWRYASIAATLAFTAAVLGLVAGGLVPFQLLGDVDAESITIDLEMTAGTPEEGTIAVIDALEREAARLEEVAGVFAIVGVAVSDRGLSVAADPATLGQLFMELTPADERERRGQRTSVRIIEELRQATSHLPGIAKLKFRAENGGPQGADIEVRVRHEDMEVASRAADHVMELLASYDGVHEVEKDLREGKLEARYRLRDGARALGLSTASLAGQLRDAVFGAEAQELQEEDDEVKVRVLLPEAARRELSDLARLRIATAAGGRVPLEEVAALETARGYSTMTRVDHRRAVTVRAEVNESTANVAEVTTDLEQRLSDAHRLFPGVDLAFEGQREEFQESTAGLRIGFPVALLAIFCLIAILFNSYTQPFIVMAVIPFSIVGAVAGHFVLGFSFTMLSLIGCVALAGIVVNDSLILVDRVNQHRRDGVPLLEAVVSGARGRLRAIVLTTITTVAGLIPLMLERSFQAQFLIPMAISIVFGLVFATALTLLVLPTAYLVFEDLRRATRWLLTGRP